MPDDLRPTVPLAAASEPVQPVVSVGTIKSEIIKKAIPYVGNMVFLVAFVLAVQYGYINVGPKLGGITPEDIHAVSQISDAVSQLAPAVEKLTSTVGTVGRTSEDATEALVEAVEELGKQVAQIESNIVSAVGKTVRTRLAPVRVEFEGRPPRPPEDDP